ncbi:hypothetical protein CMV_015105 [Castanea mollissima]|uniref:Uncharacterized protein n=1 Tax=Castanea mollissima TaxID=60419 RepID=A0A8J4QW82_9ROSI|nr:hypothetical protein CMV_015105 [Castanea mollissima]
MISPARFVYQKEGKTSAQGRQFRSLSLHWCMQQCGKCSDSSSHKYSLCFGSVIMKKENPKEARRIIVERKHRRLEKKENWKTQKKQGHMLSSGSDGVQGEHEGKREIGGNSNASAGGGGGGGGGVREGNLRKGSGGGGVCEERVGISGDGCEERGGISGAMMVVNNINNKANMVEIFGFWSWR